MTNFNEQIANDILYRKQKKLTIELSEYFYVLCSQCKVRKFKEFVNFMTLSMRFEFLWKFDIYGFFLYSLILFLYKSEVNVSV